MLCRRFIVSLSKKQCFRFSVKSSNVACGYRDKFDNLNSIGNSISFNLLTSCERNLQIVKRFKSNKKQSNKQVENEESDDEDNDVPEDKTTPVITLKVNSLRLDLVLKAGLNIARNKVETAFYESKIRVNGKKVFKKSEQVNIGDEIDLIRGQSPTNPNFLLVSRVHVLNAKENADNLSIKITRNKSLVIENYEDPWKTSGA